MDVYKRLAKKLDEMPQGFPPTDSGVELKILKKIFSPEEAEMALRIKPLPETAEVIAERLGQPVEEMRSVLDTMAKKGQIGSFKMFGQQCYMFFPFVVGIYEFQVYKMDRELVELFEEYVPVLIKQLGGYEPAVARSVPVDEQIESKSDIQPYENVREIIMKAKSFSVRECVCRQERVLAGKPCSQIDPKTENCLAISEEENAFDYFSLGGRIITREEALKVMDDAARQGLVHLLFYNVKGGHAGVCSCCTCCCGIMRGVKEFGATKLLAKSHFVAVIDPETCVQCGVCADERCPVAAVEEKDGAYAVLPDTCIGCGVCTIECPSESISLVKRPDSQLDEPPNDIIEWSMKRAAERGVDLKME